MQVLAPCDGPPPDAAVTPLGKSVPFATNGSVAPIAPDPSAAVRTIRSLRNEEFDVVHIHEPLVPGPSLTALLFSDRPIVGTFHRAGASTAYALLRPIVRRIGNRITRRGRRVRRRASHRVRRHRRRLHDPVQRHRRGTVRARRRHGRRDGRTILFVGRHESRKGLAVLLEARKALPADVTLWVAGAGPETDRLKEDVRRRPSACSGSAGVSDEELAQRLAGADIFCVPSLHGESFGVVLIEAMAAGTAIVASDIPGYRAVARPERARRPRAARRRGRARARASNALLENATRRDELVAAGRGRAGEFAMPLLAEAYADIYASLL